jgi:hypothetical protein
VQIKKADEQVRFTIKSPAYYKKFELYAFDITKPHEKIGPIPFTHTKAPEKETLYLDVSEQTLSTFFKTGSRYKWLLKPENSTIHFVESEDFFLWPQVAAK